MKKPPPLTPPASSFCASTDDATDEWGAALLHRSPFGRAVQPNHAAEGEAHRPHLSWVRRVPFIASFPLLGVIYAGPSNAAAAEGHAAVPAGLH
jgi:hypothetical protein